MNPKPHAEKLPPGYKLGTTTTGEGKRWEVEEIATGNRITQNQRTPKAAVELALRKLKGYQ